MSRHSLIIRPIGPYVGLSIAPWACLLITGCAQPTNRIDEIEPYAGSRPPQVAALPPRQEYTPPPSRKRSSAGALDGWMPPGGISNRWECIVIHHSDSDRSTPQGIRDWHVRGRGWDDIGYHFVIGNGIGYGDGKVYVGGRWKNQSTGAHCKTPGNHYNERGIGICLIGDLQHHPPTSRQIESLARLASFLCQQCGIPRSRILTHGGITHKTACPGRYFELGAVLQRMSALSALASDDSEGALEDADWMGQ